VDRLLSRAAVSRTTVPSITSVKARQRHSKSHPPKSSILPTLDASPLLDPTLFIKKTAPLPRSSRTTTAGGSCEYDEDIDDGQKRVLSCQNLIRQWIQEGLVLNADEADDDGDNDYDDQTYISHNKRFALVGHGVPMQLLQSCVDSAWAILNLGDGAVDGGDVEELFFQSVNDDDRVENSDWLDFDFMKIRTKDGTLKSTPWPFILNHNNKKYEQSREELYDLQHNLRIYLTVMARVSSAFINLNQQIPTSIDTSISSTTNTNTVIKPTAWKAEILKGFVYPPSATIFSTAFWNDGEDCSSGQRIADLTSPPIVELEYNIDPSSISAVGGVGEINSNRTVVRITLQGIQSEGIENMNKATNSATDNDRNVSVGGSTGGRGMVPVSLIFEASFQNEKFSSP